MLVDYLAQTNPDCLELLRDPAAQDVLKQFLSSGTPVTDHRFILLGFCIAISTYLSTVARSIATSIRKDAFKRRPATGKKLELLSVIVGDCILWGGVIAPLVWNIGHWFFTLPATTAYFERMRSWLSGGIFLAIGYMGVLHAIQWGRQIHQVCECLTVATKSTPQAYYSTLLYRCGGNRRNRK